MKKALLATFCIAALFVLIAKIIKPVMHDGKKKNFSLNLTELFTTISTARMNKWQ